MQICLSCLSRTLLLAQSQLSAEINTRCNTAADFVAQEIHWGCGWDAHGTTHTETLYILYL